MKKLSSGTIAAHTRLRSLLSPSGPESVDSTDLTKEINNELFIESEKYKALFELIPDVIAQTDPDGNIYIINPACVDFFGYFPEEMIGLSLVDFFVDGHSMEKMMQLVASCGHVRNYQAKLKTKNSGIKTASINARHIYDSDGDMVGIDLFIKDNTEKIKAQEEIVRAKDFYETILNALSADIAVLDMDYKYQFLNANAVKDPETRKWLLGKTDFDYCAHKGLDPTMAEERLKYYERAKTADGPFEWVEELKTKDGDSNYVLRTLERFKDRDGKSFLIGSGFDVTQLTKTKHLLTKSEGYVRSLLQSLPDLILRVNRDGVLLDFTLNDARELAMLPEMMVGKSMYQIWPAEVVYLHMHFAKEASEAGKVVTYEYPLKVNNGELRFFESRMNRINDNEVVIISRDITEKKLSEEQALKRERQLNEAQQIAKIGSYEWDPKTGQVTCSDEIFNILENSKDAYAGKIGEYFSHLHPADIQRAIKIREKITEFDSKASNEFRIITAKGNEKYIAARQTAIYNADGKIKLVVGTIQDITDQKEFEKRLFYAVIESEEKERDRIAGELHDGVCQDLTVAKLTIELADSMITDENPKLKEMIERCRKTILHSLNMTRRVSHQLMPKELFDRHFCDIVTEMIGQLNQVDCIKYELTICGARREMSPFVTINLYRIIQEFIRNSQKHSETDKLTININFSEAKLSILCKDYGKGFDMKIKEHKGIGLLNIGKRVDGIGGSFRFQSKLGQGVELSICFPL